jgi:hypothetical protein
VRTEGKWAKEIRREGVNQTGEHSNEPTCSVKDEELYE